MVWALNKQCDCTGMGISWVRPCQGKWHHISGCGLCFWKFFLEACVIKESFVCRSTVYLNILTVCMFIIYAYDGMSLTLTNTSHNQIHTLGVSILAQGHIGSRCWEGDAKLGNQKKETSLIELVHVQTRVQYSGETMLSVMTTSFLHPLCLVVACLISQTGKIMISSVTFLVLGTGTIYQSARSVLFPHSW